jgi:hypothetical protein
MNDTGKDCPESGKDTPRGSLNSEVEELESAFTKTGSEMPMRSSQIEGMSVESSGTDAFLHTGMVTRSKQNRVLKFGEGKCDVDLPSEN